MLRLSVRSPEDGHLLVRIVRREGTIFVLDFGEPEAIADANRRVGRGFTLIRMGEVITAQPDDANLLTWLAEHYITEGYLVALEEPGWQGRRLFDTSQELSADAPTELGLPLDDTEQ